MDRCAPVATGRAPGPGLQTEFRPGWKAVDGVNLKAEASGGAMNSAIQIRQCSKTYRAGFWLRPIEALQPLDLEVRAGEIFGFVGPNGAGKTTTIKIWLIAPSHFGQCGYFWCASVSGGESLEKWVFLPSDPIFTSI